MNYEVFLTNDAEDDIFDIYTYVAENDSQIKADRLFEKLKEKCLNLEELPSRGHIPPELKRINVVDYLEVHFKPYRMIYQIVDNQIFVHCVLDGRRNLQDFLLERLIR